MDWGSEIRDLERNLSRICIQGLKKALYPQHFQRSFIGQRPFDTLALSSLFANPDLRYLHPVEVERHGSTFRKRIGIQASLALFVKYF
jgi:hypothetical protein